MSHQIKIFFADSYKFSNKTFENIKESNALNEEFNLRAEIEYLNNRIRGYKSYINSQNVIRKRNK